MLSLNYHSFHRLVVRLAEDSGWLDLRHWVRHLCHIIIGHDAAVDDFDWRGKVGEAISHVLWPWRS